MLSTLPRARARARALLLLPLLLVACAGPPPPLGTSAQPIIGGVVDPNDPAVVLLAAYPPDLSVLDTCSASIISDTVLLTAAHCVDEANHPSYIYGVFPGADASAYPTLVDLQPHLLAVSAVHAHPDYDPNAPFHADLGVVVLAQPVAVTPLPINRAPLDASIVGQAARIVGYGQVVYGTFNDTKHQASTVVDALGSDDTITVGDSMRRSCVGDSGGPALVTLGGVETIVGVDSYTDTSGCTEPANYRRPDLYTAFLDLYAPPSSLDAGADASAPEVDGGSGDGGEDGGGHGGEDGGGGATTTEPPPSSARSGGCVLAACPPVSGAGALATMMLALAATSWRRRRVQVV